MSATLRGARAWLDEDGVHVWMSHHCADGFDVSMYPHPRWLATERGGVAPSFQCDKCGLHTVLPLTDTPAEFDPDGVSRKAREWHGADAPEDTEASDVHR